ncbi:ribbon-helix-helix domain-containing protein [Arthrospira platensis]|nr:type II toxin-antitoxin system ParD family antitoxin [Arthrospira platensis]MDF2207379.1 type II toxin-antitoxin system ParD family antitoxin [Arthrospira platensis NCB002]MDT9183163.1 type II toxin-antitoxin system ParD family antitoxin [Limnospira sp. PMC 289.06]MDT9296051.1 type II toxin-antitoxin system ParD family antitoxin [Arthrospira platensis PCC 7345]MDT9310864.1 type II toxin-antitoxin system ParD family antitoxin [Limnospira sp. Paracas R14]WAK73982.1 type II toxin-antitoxin sys
MQKLSFLESLVESGKYPSAEDAIATGIRLLNDKPLMASTKIKYSSTV